MTQSLITIGITYVIMSIPLFVEISLDSITLKQIQRQFYVLLLASGLTHLIAGLLSLVYPSQWWCIVIVISAITLYLFAKHIVKETLRESNKN